jgi:CTP:molybdopterin cytidylyltransferase MocA
MTDDDSAGRIFATVLAAGAARRFGATKQVAKLGGVTLVKRAMDAATEACGPNVLLVLGHDWKAVNAACDPPQGFIVRNDRYQDGLGTSIASATRSVQHVARAIIVLLADQALVSPLHIRTLCDAWSGRADEIVATEYAGTVGVPALFPSACFGDLMRLQGDNGAQRLLSDERFRLRRILFEPAAVDIDTPDDLRRISRSARS